MIPGNHRDVESFVFNAWSWRTPALGGGHDQTTPDRGPDDDRGRPANDTVEAADDGGPGFSLDLTGYAVRAVDGEIGRVEKAGDTDLVVDTGPWIFGKKVLLPAGVIQNVDLDEEKVYVNRTKDEIKDSPEFDEKTYREPAYRDRVGSYYGGTDPDSRF